MQNGTDYVEQFLKPTISDHMDILTSRAQTIAMDKEIDNKLAELRKAGENLKLAVITNVDRLIEQATVKNPDLNDPNLKEQAQIYSQWLDQAIEGVRKVHSFFDRVWSKIKELLDKIFLWIRQGFTDLGKRISKAFQIVKTTLLR